MMLACDPDLTFLLCLPAAADTLTHAHVQYSMYYKRYIMIINFQLQEQIRERECLLNNLELE